MFHEDGAYPARGASQNFILDFLNLHVLDQTRKYHSHCVTIQNS